MIASLCGSGRKLTIAAVLCIPQTRASKGLQAGPTFCSGMKTRS